MKIASNKNKNFHKKSEEIAKRRGFFWPSFEIYGGCSGFYTYGPVGSLLKLNIQNLILDWFMKQEKCMLIDAPVVTTEDPWVASGHLESFSDMTIECEKCGEAYRADHLLSEKTGKDADALSPKEIKKEILENKISCPKCGGKLGSIYNYNLMFRTEIGPGRNKTAGVLRPETAQTTYMAFKRLYELARKRIPFGVIQIGKSFRNEISPRKALVRLREFNQAEIQFFFNPSDKDKYPNFEENKEIRDIEINVITKDDQKSGKKASVMRLDNLAKKTGKTIAYFIGVSFKLYERMGIDTKKLVCRQHLDTERSFYSKDTWDIEFLSDNYGRVELVGIADRSDYDMKRHMELSNQDMRITIDGKKVVPSVIEIAYGIDRPLLCLLESTMVLDGDRLLFSFPPAISPYHVAVFPLVRKDGLPEKARQVYKMLKKHFRAFYDESGSIGRLYYRQDEIGTGFCITIDYNTMKNNDVTLRFRDNQKQIRVKINKLIGVLEKEIFGEDKKNY